MAPLEKTTGIPRHARITRAPAPLSSPALLETSAHTFAPRMGETARRQKALASTGLLDSPCEPAFDRLTKLTCRLLRVPVALVSLVDQARQFFKSSQGLPEPWASARETPLSHSFCQHVVAQNRPLVVTDARLHPGLRDNFAVRDLSVIAYLGVPLMTPDGSVIGSFCAIDDTPRTWTTDDLATLQDLAASTMTEIATRIHLQQRDQALQYFQESERRYRALVEGSIQGILISRDAKPLFVNQAYADIFGYETPEDLLTIDDMIRKVGAPHEHARLVQYATDHMQGKDAPTQYEYQGVRQDGSGVWIDNVVRHITWDGHPALQMTIIDITARKQAQETLQKSYDALEQRVAERTIGLQTANERLRTEMTERKRLETLLHQAQKMEALGLLAGGIAHDFNNILGVMLGFADLLAYDIAPGSGAWNHLQEILQAGRRAKDLVQQILTFSRQQPSQRQPIALHTVLREALALLRSLLPPTIDLRDHIDPHTGRVMADSSQVHQVIMNLCVNAEHAMRDTGGVLEVRLDAVDVPVDFAADHPPLAPGPHLRITICDTGHGMDAACLARLFDPFFTTKAVGEGTGLGLAVVHGIVTGHGGAITVESVLGEGTSFAIYMPRTLATPEAGAPAPDTRLPQGAGRILFVDDNALLAQVSAAMLERCGYEVVSFTSSPQALEAFRQAPQDFDLVITDHTMPLMTGEQLARELRQTRPDIPIILCTGFSPLMTEQEALAMEINAYCLKPLVGHELARTTQQVLAESAHKRGN